MSEENSKKYCIVSYKIVAGEYIHTDKMVFKLNDRTLEEEIDEYFSKFFGPGTEQHGNQSWNDKAWFTAVRVSGWGDITEEDYLVLKKYMHYVEGV